MYICIEAERKLDTLFSFIKSHKESKCIVFFSSCKQVRHAYESFSKIKTGSSILELHGRQKQTKRTAIYFEFVERKHAYLFATDIASRGMDFPAVDWVIQVDLPENTDTYIHRAGRTARYKYKGSALLMVQPHEMAFVEKLQGLNIDMKKLKANPNRTLTITSALQRINAENTDLMHLAQKAFVCYIRSVFKNGDKKIFDVTKIDHEALGLSMGLVTTPIIEFVTGDEVKNSEAGKHGKISKIQKLRDKTRQRQLEKLALLAQEDGSESEEEGRDPGVQPGDESYHDTESEHESDLEEVPEPEDDLFTIKRTIQPDEPIDDDTPEFEPRKIFSKNSLKKIKKGGVAGGANKIYFDNEGKSMTSLEYHIKVDSHKTKTLDEGLGDAIKPEDYFSKLKQSLGQNKEVDDQIAKDRINAKRMKKKRQRLEREQRNTSQREVYDQEDEDEEQLENVEEVEEIEEVEEVEEPTPKRKHKRSKVTEEEED
jgi:ATP-dependent RNA helicase DDX10/DBP4